MIAKLKSGEWRDVSSQLSNENDLSEEDSIKLDFLLALSSGCKKDDINEIIDNNLAISSDWSFLIVKDCDLPEIKALHEYGVDFNTYNETGFNVIWSVVFNNRLDVLKFLLSIGVNPNNIDSKSEFPDPLLTAISRYPRDKSYALIIEQLLNSGAQIKSVHQTKLASLMQQNLDTYLQLKNTVPHLIN